MLFIYLFIILKLIYCINWSIFFLSFQNPCESIPCANHATCQAGFGNHGYRCICPAGYQGVQCKTGEGKKHLTIKRWVQTVQYLIEFTIKLTSYNCQKIMRAMLRWRKDRRTGVRILTKKMWKGQAGRGAKRKVHRYAGPLS